MSKYKIEQLRISTEFSEKSLRNKIARVLGIFPNEIDDVKILSQSIDARKKPPVNVISAEISLLKSLEKNIKNVKEIDVSEFAGQYAAVLSEKKADIRNIKNLERYSSFCPKNSKISISYNRPVIVGFGPAGISAAYILAKAGLSPIVYERGEPILDRQKKANAFWRNGVLDENSNVLFGEGGAGLFSDGKLTSRSKDKENREVFLHMLIRHGANKSILTDTRAHIGTDVLAKILKSIREEIISLGGEINFNSQLTDIKVEDKKISGIFINSKFVETKSLVLAIGHSARDTYRALQDKIITEKKPFAIGVRIEFEQDLINRLQYGEFSQKMPAASFRLVSKAQNEMLPCYTFCMCPGGQVIACSSQKGLVSTNGMSYAARDMKFGNAAFLTPVNSVDLDFLDNIEKKSFERGGSDYSLPAQNLASFLYEKDNKFDYELSPHRYKITDISGILPSSVEQTLRFSVPKMLGTMGKIDFSRAAIFAAETGSSSPLRILRSENTLQSHSAMGVYPCGEGAGYAGGIVSSGIDGVKCATALLNSL